MNSSHTTRKIIFLIYTRIEFGFETILSKHSIPWRTTVLKGLKLFFLQDLFDENVKTIFFSKSNARKFKKRRLIT